MDNLDEIISKNISLEIQYSGKTKAEIARELCLSKQTVSQYCSGRSQPTLSTFAKLCRFLDCSADDILNLK